jgi:ABC-type multidrug transport system permease subunit
VGVLQTYLSDLYVAWKLILAMVGVSLIVSLIYSVLIRYFAGFMVWLMILLLLTLLLVLGVGTAMLSQDVEAIKKLIDYDSLP